MKTKAAKPQPFIKNEHLCPTILKSGQKGLGRPSDGILKGPRNTASASMIVGQSIQARHEEKATNRQKVPSPKGRNQNINGFVGTEMSRED